MNAEVNSVDQLLDEITQLRKQLSFANAQNLITETIISNDDTHEILQSMAQIIGSTLNVDRSLIYDMDFTKHQVIGLCEWLNPDAPNVTPTKDTYSRDVFKNGTDYMMETGKWIQSHVDDMNPLTISDGSGELLHNLMQIKSGLWYPFSIHEQGFYCLVFNQVNHRRIWSPDEIDFITAVAKQVEIAIQKINFLTKQKLAEEELRLNQLRFKALLKLNQMSGATLQKISEFVLEEVINLSGSEFGFIGFMNEEETKLNLATCSNEEILKSNLHISLSELVEKIGVMKEVVLQRSPIIINDFINSNNYSQEYQDKLPLERLMSIPIFEANQIVIVACVANKKENYNISDVQQITLLIEGVWQIIQRNNMGEMLRLSEERFSKAFNYSPISMSIHSTNNGQYIDANESCLTLHEYSREEFVGWSQENLNVWVDGDEQARFLNDIDEKGFAHNHEVKIRKKSGEIFVALLSGVIIDLNGEQCILEIKTNITELRQYQKEIARLDRLNVIGQMAAGIAHEIRNPMTTVRGFLQILENKESYLLDKTYFNLMIDELDRVNSIIIEFLSLAQHRSLDLRKQNLNDIIKVISPLMLADAMLTDSYINLKLAEIPELSLNEKEIRQLIINLVRNGLEAMPTGGHLTIKTYLKNNEVIMSIQDQGEGIDPNILEKIGTPFFTTKDNGTGLGLATSYSIANRHNAKVEIKTSSTGTTFYVKFKL